MQNYLSYYRASIDLHSFRIRQAFQTWWNSLLKKKNIYIYIIDELLRQFLSIQFFYTTICNATKN